MHNSKGGRVRWTRVWADAERTCFNEPLILSASAKAAANAGPSAEPNGMLLLTSSDVSEPFTLSASPIAAPPCGPMSLL